MKPQVIYFSRKGSTKKVADAIASELNVQAQDVKNAELKDDTFIFLGSGNYGSKPGKAMIKFIEDTDFSKRKVALFGTSGGGEGKETEVMQSMLQGKNANVKGTFFCKGKFWFGNKDKPSDQDVADAKKFAKKMINLLK
jgi:flavodoxin